MKQYPDVLSVYQVELTEYSMILSCLRQNLYEQKDIPFRIRLIQDMLDLGVIEPSISSYSSPIVLVPKKDGSVRFCIDFRKLNKVTEFDAEPMPNME